MIFFEPAENLRNDLLKLSLTEKMIDFSQYKLFQPAFLQKLWKLLPDLILPQTGLHLDIGDGQWTDIEE